MNINFITDLAISYTDEDIEFIRQQRKYFARKEQTETDKTTRKMCQRYVKATTIVINELLREPGVKKPTFHLNLELTLGRYLYLLIAHRELNSQQFMKRNNDIHATNNTTNPSSE